MLRKTSQHMQQSRILTLMIGICEGVKVLHTATPHLAHRFGCYHFVIITMFHCTRCLTKPDPCDMFSGVGRFEGSGGSRALGEFHHQRLSTPHPCTKKKSHRIFTFCMDPTGQHRGGPDPWTPVQLRRWICLSNCNISNPISMVIGKKNCHLIFCY